MANTYIPTVQGITQAVNIFNSIGEKRVDGYREWLASQYAILDNSFRQEVLRVGGVGATVTEENYLQKLEELRAKKFALIDQLPGDMKQRLSSYAQVLISNSQTAVMESFRDAAVKEYLFTMNKSMENYYKAGDIAGVIRVAKKADEDNVLPKSQVMGVLLPRVANMIVDMKVAEGVKIENVPTGELLSMWNDVVRENLKEYGADEFDGLFVDAVSKVIQERLAATDEKIISTVNYVRNMINEGQMTEDEANKIISELIKSPYLTATAKMRLDNLAMGVNMASLFAIGKSFYDDMMQKYPKDSKELSQDVENKYVNDAKAAMKQFLVYHDLKEVENSKAFMDILTAVESSIRSYAQRREGGIYGAIANGALGNYFAAKAAYTANANSETRKNLQIAANGVVDTAIKLLKTGDSGGAIPLLELFINESEYLAKQNVITGQTQQLLGNVAARNTQTDPEGYKSATVDMIKQLFPNGVNFLESLPGWKGFGKLFNDLMNTNDPNEIRRLARDKRYEILEEAILLASQQPGVTITEHNVKVFILEVQKTNAKVENVQGAPKAKKRFGESDGHHYLELLDTYTTSELKTRGEETIAPSAIKGIAQVLDFKGFENMNILGFSNATRTIKTKGNDNIVNLEMDVTTDTFKKPVRLMVEYKINDKGDPVYDSRTTKMWIVNNPNMATDAQGNTIQGKGRLNKPD